MKVSAMQVNCFTDVTHVHVPPSASRATTASPTSRQTAGTQPAVSQTGMTQPTVTQPGMTQPGMTQTAVTQPGMTQTGLTQPDVTHPAVTQPDETQPGMTQTGVTQPDETQPGVTQTGVTQPDVTQPAVTQPGVIQTGMTQAGTTKPTTKQPITTEPNTPKPGTFYSDRFVFPNKLQTLVTNFCLRLRWRHQRRVAGTLFVIYFWFFICFCLFAFAVELPTGEGVAGTLSVIHDWGQRFEGQIDFPVKDDVEGWMANITFSAPVTKMDVSLLRQDLARLLSVRCQDCTCPFVCPFVCPLSRLHLSLCPLSGLHLSLCLSVVMTAPVPLSVRCQGCTCPFVPQSDDCDWSVRSYDNRCRPSGLE